MILKSINGYFYYSYIDPFILLIKMHIIELNNIKNTRVWYKKNVHWVCHVYNIKIRTY